MKTVSWQELPNNIYVIDLFIETNMGMERVMKFAYIFKKNNFVLLNECSQYIDENGNPKFLAEFKIPLEEIVYLRFDDGSDRYLDTVILARPTQYF